MEIIIRLILLFLQVTIMSISIVYSIKIYNKWISPISVYICMNGIAILLYQLNMLNFNDINNSIILILILSELTLFIGDIFGRGIYNSFRQIKSKENLNIVERYESDAIVHLAMYIIFLVSFIGITISAKRVFKIYSVSFLLKNPAYLELAGFQQQYLGYLNLMGIMILPMFCFYVIKTKKIKFIDIACVILALFGLFLSGNKTYIIISVITALFVYVHLTPVIRVKYAIYVSIICIVFFVFYRNNIDVFYNSLVESKFPAYLKDLEAPYEYITGGWAAFSYWGIGDPGNIFPYRGYVVASAVFKLLSFFNLTNRMTFQPLDFIPIGGGRTTNVYTMVGEVYLDIGPIGLVIIYLIIGILCSYIYNVALNIKSLVSIFISSLLMYCLFISFFLYFLNFNILFLCCGTYAAIYISKFILLKKRNRYRNKYKTTKFN